jgi:hypothetical protein
MIWGLGVETRKPSAPSKRVRAGGDLPGGLSRHPEIIPAGRESRQEGANIRKGTEAVKTLFSSTGSLLCVVIRRVIEKVISEGPSGLAGFGVILLGARCL